MIRSTAAALAAATLCAATLTAQTQPGGGTLLVYIDRTGVEPDDDMILICASPLASQALERSLAAVQQLGTVIGDWYEENNVSRVVGNVDRLMQVDLMLDFLIAYGRRILPALHEQLATGEVHRLAFDRDPPVPRDYFAAHDLPAGDYVLVARVEERTFYSERVYHHPVTITAGDTTSVELWRADSSSRDETLRAERLRTQAERIRSLIWDADVDYFDRNIWLQNRNASVVRAVLEPLPRELSVRLGCD